MLGQQDQAGVVEGRSDPVVDPAQAGNGREQPERAAASGQEQRAVSGGDLVGIVAANVGDNDNPGLLGVIERRGDTHAARRQGQVASAGANLGAGPVVIEGVVIEGVVGLFAAGR